MTRIQLPCGHHVTESQILSLASAVMRSRRKSPGGKREGAGRPRKLVTCEACGASGGTVEMRRHKCVVLSRG